MTWFRTTHAWISQSPNRHGSARQRHPTKRTNCQSDIQLHTLGVNWFILLHWDIFWPILKHWRRPWPQLAAIILVNQMVFLNALLPFGLRHKVHEWMATLRPFDRPTISVLSLRALFRNCQLIINQFGYRSRLPYRSRHRPIFGVHCATKYINVSCSTPLCDPMNRVFVVSHFGRLPFKKLIPRWLVALRSI